MKKLFSLDNINNVIANVVATVGADISKKYSLLQILSQTYTARTHLDLSHTKIAFL